MSGVRFLRGERDMIDGARRWLGACAWELTGRVSRNRLTLYGGAAGLRILTFHDTGPGLALLRHVVQWCAEHGELATPADADAACAGVWPHGGQDRVLITFDDGLERDHEAAAWLANAGIRAIFFVVPSLIGRSTAEFLEYHRAQGVEACPPVPDLAARGLSRTQVAEMLEMGHRIGAHNFAHRDLGNLHGPGDLEYEIGRALDGIAQLTGSPCEDFALAYGQPENVSDEAAAFLLARCPRIYACHRGLNVPGKTPRFLLRHSVEPDHPFAFTRVCVRGGGDHYLASRATLLASRVGRLPDVGRSESNSK